MNDTIHTEIVCGGRHIGFDLWCSEACLQEHLNTNYIYEPEVTAAILNFVRPGDFCIDAGANLGYHSTLMAKLVGKDGLVLAFEPDQDCFEKMQRNFLLNEVDDICFPNPVALWNEDYQSFAFFIGPCGYSSVVRYSALAQTASSVQTRALDNIINSDVHVKLLKIDCEGAEEKILHGEAIVKGRLTCRSGGKSITKMQYGNKDIMMRKGTDTPLSIGNDLKAAATDCLKKCASELGIASDIYNKQDFKEVLVDTAEVDTLELKELYDVKKNSLRADEIIDAERILGINPVGEPKKKSFQKLKDYLQSK